MAEKEQWLEVFKVGKWNNTEWTEEDIKAIADNYNNQDEDTVRKAPLTYGHERKDSDPALGWVEKLKVVGKKLYAYVTDISKDLISQIKDGAYNQVSIGMDDIENVGWMLTHIAVLGAVQPAVGGMTPLKEYFASNKPKVTYLLDIPVKFVKFATDQDTIATLKAEQQARADKFGIGVKDKIGYIDKPKAYIDIPDDQFADPVNYLYPIDSLANLVATLRVFNYWDSNYTDIEKQIIVARIYTAAETFGIDIKPERIHLSLTKPKTLEFEIIDKLVDLKQSERSQKYNIEIKKVGNRIKPKGYADLTDDDFADPVHYRFPLTKKLIKSSLSNWNKESVKEKYSTEEQEIINDRILKAAAEHGIQIKTENKLQTKGVINMTQEQYDSFVSEFSQFLTDSFGEDIARSATEWIEGKKASLITANADPAATGSNNSNNDDPDSIKFAAREKVLMEKIEKLENDGRTKDFKAYLEKLTVNDKKLVPAQADRALAILEMAHKNGKVSFSQNSKTMEMEGVQLVKEFMESYEQILDLDGIPNPNTKPINNNSDFEGIQVDESRMELHNKVIEFMAKPENKTLTYAEALQKVNKGEQ